MCSEDQSINLVGLYESRAFECAQAHGSAIPSLVEMCISHSFRYVQRQAHFDIKNVTNS